MSESTTGANILTLWVYDTASREVLAEITGPDELTCESIAAARWPQNRFGWTFTPMFGASDALTQRAGRERIEA